LCTFLMIQQAVLDDIRSLIQTHTDKQIGEKYGISKHAVKRLRYKHDIQRPNTFLEKLESSGFDGDSWRSGWIKTETESIHIYNDKGAISYDDIKEEMIEEMKKHAPKYPVIKRDKVTDGHLLIIDPADVHIGKLSALEETGAEYNIEMAKQRCLDGVNGIIQKAAGFPIEKIIFVIGNDILHTDNPFRTTTAGTAQDTDGMWWQSFKEAKDLYVRIIETLVTVADVQVVFCPSNHDYASGFMLADSLSSWFHNAENVTFNVDIIHRKYIKYGLNMLAFDHGDGSKEINTKDLMADEQAVMWGETKFRYAYKHHLHHKRKVNWLSGKDYIGITVEYLRSPSPADGWHHRNGYISPKAVEGFIHSKDNGQVARLTHYF
jgi:hypothetical protein